MIKEIPIFKKGIYRKPCKLFPKITIGSILCVNCKYCVSYKEQNSFYLKILKINTPIVSEIICNRANIQLTLF